MRLWIDFHDIEDDNLIWADLDYAQFFFDQDLQVGKDAELTDGAGHECRATITDIDLDRRIVWLRIDWDTWKFTERSRLQQGFRSAGGYRAKFVRSGKPREPVA